MSCTQHCGTHTQPSAQARETAAASESFDLTRCRDVQLILSAPGDHFPSKCVVKGIARTARVGHLASLQYSSSRLLR